MPEPSGSSVAAASPDASSLEAKDVVLVHGVSRDGERYHVLRARDGQVQAGVVERAAEGKPIHGELVRFTARPESPLLYDVHVEYAPAENEGRVDSSTPPAASRGRPAQVSTAAYRRNWERLFGRSASDPLAN